MPREIFMPSKKKNNNSLILLRLSSLADMARYAYNFNFTFDSVFLEKIGKREVICAFGEKIDGKTLLYTLDTDKPAKFIRYKPPENDDREEASLVQEYFQGTQTINITSMQMESLGVVKNTEKLKFKALELPYVEDLIKLGIKSSSAEEDGLACLYCFSEGDEGIVYGIDLVEKLRSDDTVIYYAKIKNGKHFSFARYDYKNGKAEFAEAVGEHSYMYLKIINLAEKPFFFRSNK